MLDLSSLSASTHGAFAVDVTVSRSGEDDRTERAVLHLGRREWHTHSTRDLIAIDAIDFLADVDIQPDDQVACSDTSQVPSASTWTIRDQLPEDGDRHIQSWRMTQTRSSEAL